MLSRSPTRTTTSDTRTAFKAGIPIIRDLAKSPSRVHFLLETQSRPPPRGERENWRTLILTLSLSLSAIAIRAFAHVPGHSSPNAVSRVRPFPSILHPRFCSPYGGGGSIRQPPVRRCGIRTLRRIEIAWLENQSASWQSSVLHLLGEFISRVSSRRHERSRHRAKWA